MPTESGPWREKTRNANWMCAGHGSSMREVNESCVVWYEPIEGLLWRKSSIILMLVEGVMHHDPQCVELRLIWSYVAAGHSEC